MDRQGAAFLFDHPTRSATCRPFEVSIMLLFRAACCAACLVFPTALMAQSDDPPFTVTGSVDPGVAISLPRHFAVGRGSRAAGHDQPQPSTAASMPASGARSLDGFGELGGSNLELDLYAGWRHPGRPTASPSTPACSITPIRARTGGDFEFFEPYANVSRHASARRRARSASPCAVAGRADQQQQPLCLRRPVASRSRARR